MKLLKNKINFLIIGTQKGGTSALDHYLRQHPEIGMATKKEVHFFDDEEQFLSSPVNYLNFEDQFDFSTQKKIYGEATPIYMYWNSSIKRIWEYNKNMQLIVILRNPIDRAFSHWNMEMNRQAETEDFMHCIKNEPSRVKEALPLQHRVYSYVDRGFYSKQLRPILQFFNRSQLHFIKYEEFEKNQEHTLQQLFHFLNVDSENYNFQKEVINKTAYARVITKEESNYLLNAYIDDITEVENILGWDCSDWKTISEAVNTVPA